MSDKQFKISRRSVLAGLGTIGIASAGAGLGTTAYFSDEETFEDNRLQAGEFDLKLDWEHKYFGPEMSDVYGDAGRPYVNAFPDEDGDGMRDMLKTRGTIAADLGADVESQAVEDAFRAQFADMGDVAMPVIDLQDVKPGDSGCLSMSMHLFDNPGYIWLGNNGYESLENGQTEPEEETEGTDTDGEGELLDATNATLWYDDDGDCEIDGGGVEGDADVVIVFDRSGSMTNEPNKFENAKNGAKALIDALGSGAQVGLVSYAAGAVLDEQLGTDPATVKSTIDSLSAGGTTNIEAAIQVAQTELDSARATSANQIMVLMTNGTPTASGDPVDDATAAKNAGTEIYTVAYGSNANAGLLADISSDPDSQYSYVAADIASVEQVFAQIGQIIAGEEVIISGTLREVLDELQDGIELDGNRVADGRQCFVNSTTQYVGLHWEVPTDVGNEIQSDSVTFDLSFVAEQCRHNDGQNNPFQQPA
jgi:predicted ribosomally synthesized peptide with SipW-like signal peptide